MKIITAYCLFLAAAAGGSTAFSAEMSAAPLGGAVLGNLPMARPSSGKVPEVKKSSAAASVQNYYTAEKMRDPFMKAVAGGVIKSDIPEEFSIHNLTLRGMLKDSWVDYAVFTDAVGGTFLFRKNKLYDGKRNEVQGVTGTMDIKQKTVNLITQDKDVQVFRLGQKDEEEEAKN